MRQVVFWLNISLIYISVFVIRYITVSVIYGKWAEVLTNCRNAPFVQIQCKINPTCKQSPEKYAFSKGNYTGLRQSLQSVLWEDLFSVHINNVEDMWQVFKHEMQIRIEKFIPKTNSFQEFKNCLLYTSPSPRDRQKSRMPSSA